MCYAYEGKLFAFICLHKTKTTYIALDKVTFPMGFYHQIHTKTTCFGSGKGTKTDCCDTLFKGKTTCFACSASTMDNAKIYIFHLAKL